MTQPDLQLKFLLSINQNRSFLSLLHSHPETLIWREKSVQKLNSVALYFHNAITRDVYTLMSNTSTDLFFPLSLSKVAELDFFK